MFFLLVQMRQLEKNDKNSKSLLANVLDLEDDFLLCSRSSFTVTGKPDGSNHPPPASIPHLYQNSQHSNSDTNLSSAITQPSYRRKTSVHNSHVIGRHQILSISAFVLWHYTKVLLPNSYLEYRVVQFQSMIRA